MSKKKYSFYTNCIHADGDAIGEMKRAGKDVSYRTMLRNCKELVDLSLSLNYVKRRNQDHGLTMRNDWHVGYAKSTYKGMPCYYLTYSGIEYIWTKDDP